MTTKNCPCRYEKPKKKHFKVVKATFVITSKDCDEESDSWCHRPVQCQSESKISKPVHKKKQKFNTIEWSEPSDWKFKSEKETKSESCETKSESEKETKSRSWDWCNSELLEPRKPESDKKRKNHKSDKKQERNWCKTESGDWTGLTSGCTKDDSCVSRAWLVTCGDSLRPGPCCGKPNKKPTITIK